MMKEITVEHLQHLQDLCLEYDKKMGDYPESTYEGFSFLLFIHDKLSLPYPREKYGLWDNLRQKEE